MSMRHMRLIITPSTTQIAAPWHTHNKCMRYATTTHSVFFDVIHIELHRSRSSDSIRVRVEHIDSHSINRRSLKRGESTTPESVLRSNRMGLFRLLIASIHIPAMCSRRLILVARSTCIPATRVALFYYSRTSHDYSHRATDE